MVIRFFLRLAFIFLFSISANAQLLLKLTNDTLKTFSYSWADEFNSKTVDENTWRLLPWPKVNMSQGFSFDTHNTTLEDGLLVLSMRKKDSVYTLAPQEIDNNYLKEEKIVLVDNKFRLKYTAGMVQTLNKVHYGLYELRFKVEKGKGVWPAFWFYGGFKNEEIDAFELKGEKNDKIHVDTHCPYGCDHGYKNKLGFNTNWGDWMPISDFLHDGFNIMLLEWKLDEVIWYINGYPLAYFKGKFSNPMYLYINTQVAADGRAFKPGPDTSTIFPNNFYVDYIRQWTPNLSASTPTLKANSQVNISKKYTSDYLNNSLRQRGLMYIKKKFKAEEGLITMTLSKSGKLVINAIGELAQKGNTLTIITSKESISYKDFGSEKEMQLEQNESEIQMKIKSRSREYSQTIKIEW